MAELDNSDGARWSVTVEDNFGTWYARPRGGYQTRPLLMNRNEAKKLYLKLQNAGEFPMIRKGP